MLLGKIVPQGLLAMTLTLRKLSYLEFQFDCVVLITS